MKQKKRILSLLLAFVLALTLLPTTAFATEDIKTVAVTVSGMEWGKPRPGIGSFSVADSDLQVSKITWTAADDGKVTYNNRVVITVDIKKGVDAKFVKETSIKASVNGVSNGIVKKRASDTQVTITYTIKVANPNEAAEQAAVTAAVESAVAATQTSTQNYDTFDYRAYANVYPDVKAAYGYDAQKLWAHYVNYGKAEGRVASYINAAGNPKSGAAYYKNALEGTAYGNDNHNYNAIVPATYLDTLPPSNYDTVQNWHDFQLTRPQNMSNAKLVAEWYRLNTLLQDKETGFSYPLVTMHRYWDIEGEIGARAKYAELLYCYENDVAPKVYWRSSDVTYERIQDVKNGNPSGAEYQRILQTDYLILLHWLYSYNNQAPYSYRSIFPTPPADPGTVSTTAAAAATAPAAAKPTTVGGFSDVPADSYYAKAVVWAVEKGVTGGMSTGVFGPNVNCTQGQIITFLWRAAGQPSPKGTTNPPGLDSSKYYYKAVQWAMEQGIIEGSFDPDALCTRATAMMYLWINGGRKTSASENYKDVPRDSPYRQAIDWAAGMKITGGTGDGNFSPDQVCTRAQIVTFLYRAFNK